MAKEQYVTLADVRDVLAAESKRRELLPSQKNAMAQSSIYALSAEKASELKGRLMELDFVDAETAVKIADILPRYSNDVRAIFYKKHANLDAEKIQKVLDIVSAYL